MAAGTLPAPGTPYGPCTNTCKHRDCQKTREMAESTCPLCQTPIGYEKRFYTCGEQLFHAVCLESSIENEQKNELKKRIQK